MRDQVGFVNAPIRTRKEPDPGHQADLGCGKDPSVDLAVGTLTIVMTVARMNLAVPPWAKPFGKILALAYVAEFSCHKQCVYAGRRRSGREPQVTERSSPMSVGTDRRSKLMRVFVYKTFGGTTDLERPDVPELITAQLSGGRTDRPPDSLRLPNLRHFKFLLRIANNSHLAS